ncbi:hypothetical protein RDI58_025647 [Solanum bulbocastanum]|uniref:U3 small nucleolar RNA-associated protein 18 homolog n=1 Tax=Solanum bulbocastanum TaxID=147425 RepID=A0AAN8Y4G2_SOLBU
MASLISQNITHSIGDEKSKRKTKGEGKEESEKKINRKRKKEYNEENKEVEIKDKREMEKLENLLFGSLYNPVGFGKDDEDEKHDDGGNDSAMFFVDRAADSALSVYEGDAQLVQEGIVEVEKERKPVWVDDEEEKASINIASVNRLRKLRKEEGEDVVSGSMYVERLRAQHAKLNPGTEWAQIDYQSRNYSSDDEDSDEEGKHIDDYDSKDVKLVDDILQSNQDLVVKSRTKLLPGLLEYSRLVDANAVDPSNAPINSVQFHKNSQLLLVGGLDKKLRFFQIDGKRNTKIQSIFLEDFPIKKASFLPNGSQVIISGRRKFFHVLDLVKASVDKVGPLVGREEKSLESFEVSPDSDTIAFLGNEGYILLVSTKTKELIGTLKMNGTVRSAAFSDDGQQLLSSGGDGHIYHWDLRTRTCIHKGVDEGSINGTALCTSPNGSLFASGSDSGIVNIYNKQEFLGGKRRPIKAIENLTTKVDFMKFNHDAQILAISSGMKKNSSKLIHIPSFTVFSNWPSPNRAVHYPRCLDFSPHGGFMALGNAAGKVLLYKLHHYHDA